MAHPRDILLELHASPRKSFSQNFLTSPHWADRLAGMVTETPGIEEVWEIGPGLGALTSVVLAKTSLPVKVFEVDRKLAAYLRGGLAKAHARLEVLEGDVLERDLKTVSPGKKIAVLSNLPYHLSSPILFKLLELKERTPRLVLTFQKEFAERLLAGPRTPDYGALSVVSQIQYRMESLGVLPPGAFYPMPGVASEALLFEPKPNPEVGSAHVSHLLKAAFRQRRKKLASNLKAAFPKAPVPALLESLGLSPTVRPEELTREQFLELTRLIRPYICETICEA